jgi:antitoxin (DNA-binding transcriptional repressor) of toxin-antitoxin stability system
VEHLTVSEARARLPELLDRVERGEDITITRHGRPVAVLLRHDTVRIRRGESTIDRAREIGRMIEEARHQPLGEPTMDAAYAEELVREIRAGRDDD